MSKVKKAISSIMMAVLLLGSAACGPMSDGGTGTVVAHSKKHRIRCSVRSCYTYKITTERTGSGTRDTGQVGEAVYKACPIGAAWPACKKRANR